MQKNLIKSSFRFFFLGIILSTLIRSRLYVRSSGANTTASSSCSNEDPETGCVCGRRLTTPVQFCTSPPMDVHRPRRKPWTPPPPKVFHVMASSHSASFDLTQEEDDEIVDIENRARPRQAAFMPGIKPYRRIGYFSVSNRNPEHFYYFSTFFTPGSPS